MRASVVALLSIVHLGLLAHAGCGGANAPAAAGGTPAASSALPQLPPGPPDPYATRSGAGGGPSASEPFPDREDDTLTPPDRAEHQRAREAARAGRLHEAKRLLGHLVAGYLGNELLIAQYNAVGARIEAAQATAKASLEAAPLRAVPPAPATYALARNAPVVDPVVPKLVKRSQTKNGIVDDEAWFTKNNVHTPVYFVPPARDFLFGPGVVSSTTVGLLGRDFVYTEFEPSGRFLLTPLPLFVPLAYGTLPLQKAIDSSPYVVALYGARMVAVFDVATERVVGLFDLASYAHPPANVQGKVVVGHAELRTPGGTQRADITAETSSITLSLMYALARDGVLYVEHAANSYAKEAHNQTAYITALDLASGDMLWRSAPLVANGETFLLHRGAVVCGYGFTAEPRFVFVLDRATGVKKQTISTSTTPGIFVLERGAIFVRGYDSDFVFDVR